VSDPDARELASRLLQDESAVMQLARLVYAMRATMRAHGIEVEHDFKEMKFTAEGLRMVPFGEELMEGQ
jgi:hypothetical protein